MNHLLHRADFQAVMASEVASRTPHFVLHRRRIRPAQVNADSAPTVPAKPVPQASRIGVVLPKRLAKAAVTRNALKRQIYNIMDAFEHRLPCADHVVRLRAVFDRQLFISATSPRLKRAVREELHQLLDRVLVK